MMFAIAATATLLFSTVSIILLLAKPTFSQPTACSAQSSLIAFDDIISTTSISGVPVPNGYNRLNWENVLVVNGINYYTPNTGYTTGVVSPPYLVFNGYGNPMAVTNMATSTFTINSFYSCAAWHDNTILTMTGTRSGAVLYTKKAM
ncbi:unnamed protein product [Rotaria sordida]|uniref:Uncharacterized protein n=1 Tax=Rotaria sordida TaxID=392033 RepID=A0A815QF39_9BILA|nr:unnamed protein product [Rotaria sordida]CAF1462354.1 unnamed protein product [Rotaria sordida]